jgi:hypothetical protein
MAILPYGDISVKFKVRKRPTLPEDLAGRFRSRVLGSSVSFSECLDLATTHSFKQPFQFFDLDVSGDEDLLGAFPPRRGRPLGDVHYEQFGECFSGKPQRWYTPLIKSR